MSDHEDILELFKVKKILEDDIANGIISKDNKFYISILEKEKKMLKEYKKNKRR